MGKRKQKPAAIAALDERTRLDEVVRESFAEITVCLDVDADEEHPMYMASLSGSMPVIEHGTSMASALHALAFRLEGRPANTKVVDS